MVVNTCGFLNSAIDESLEVIGEAVAENGKVLVTGCLGNKADLIKKISRSFKYYRPSRL